VPRHVAIVMDGNGRWASKRFLPRIAGHKQGLEALKRIVRLSAKRGIEVLTVFAFSSENWKRPPEEVSGLMTLLAFALSKEVPALHREGVRLRIVGATEHLSARVQESLAQAQDLTAANTGLLLNVCFNYGGRWDIAQAARRMVEAGLPITEEGLNDHMATSHCCEPDLLIRTGGEMRLSNFLLWQAAYSELFFSNVLWPDFDDAALDAALLAFASRERRFGMTSEQLPSGGGSAT